MTALWLRFICTLDVVSLAMHHSLNLNYRQLDILDCSEQNYLRQVKFVLSETMYIVSLFTLLSMTKCAGMEQVNSSLGTEKA